MSRPSSTARRGPNVLVIGTLVVLAVVVVAFLVWQGRQNAAVPAAAQNGHFDLSGQPTLGPASAKVTVVAFEDFKCPVCQRYDQTIFPDIQKNYIDTGKIHYAFFNFPFIGPDSTTAAIAGECVVNQNPALFWPYSHLIYRGQKDENTEWATPDYLVELAGIVDGIDTGKLRSCIDAQSTLARVNADKETGVNAGVNGTPTIYVNGVKARDFSYASVSAAIDAALK